MAGSEASRAPAELPEALLLSFPPAPNYLWPFQYLTKGLAQHSVFNKYRGKNENHIHEKVNYLLLIFKYK